MTSIKKEKLNNMAFVDMMKKRYSTKLYDAGSTLSPDVIKELQEILRLSPSSINSQPWQFVFVGDDSVKKELAEASYGNKARIEDCSHLVVFNVFTDMDKLELHINRNLPQGSVDYFTNYILPQGQDKVINWSSKQVYLALGVFLAACADMGIDATPMEGIQVDAYDRILAQEGYGALVAVAIGKRHEEDFNQPHKTPKSRAKMEEVILEL